MIKNKVLPFIMIILVLSGISYFLLQTRQDITGKTIAVPVKAVTTFGGERPPSQGGGSAGAQAECCTTVWWNDREFWCDCVVNERGLIRIQPYTCCKNPLAMECFDFCELAEYPEEQAPVGGICPTERTCGATCCNQGEQCENGQCFVPQQEYQLPPPPQLEGPALVAIPYTTYSFPWWYFILAAIILLILSYMLYKKTHAKLPAEAIPGQKQKKHRKK